MISSNEVERVRQEAAESGRSGIHVAIALSLVCSLAIIAIISKRHLSNYLWLDFAVFVIPIPIAVYFKRRIAILGGFMYVAALILFLFAAVLFGI
jgi:hypothetical protein